MPRSRQHRYQQQTSRQHASQQQRYQNTTSKTKSVLAPTTLAPTTCLAPALALIFIILVAAPAYTQSTPPASSFRQGQSMYIVAFRLIQFPVILDETDPVRQREYINDLDAERKVRKEIEEWRFFKVAEKPSDADFIFLVRLDGSSIEGLAIPVEAYRQHFKEKFDLDSLRDAAFGRYLVGPLNLPTLSRLTDRLVKQFREKLTKPGP